MIDLINVYLHNVNTEYYNLIKNSLSKHGWIMSRGDYFGDEDFTRINGSKIGDIDAIR